MNRKASCFLCALVAAVVIGHTASAQLPIVFDENYYPTNPDNSFGAFTHGDFSATGAFTDGPSSFILNVTDADSSNGVFGGVGVDYGNPPSSNPLNFDPASAVWELRIKILPLNAATALRTAYIDDDGGFPVAAEEYIYEFDLTSVPNDGMFHVLTKPVSNPLFNQSAFGFDANDDGTNNPGLRQIQIQSPFASTGRLNVEIDYVRIVPVIPEPASLILLGVAAPAVFLVMRRRRVG
jgi:hypothetical protein